MNNASLGLIWTTADTVRPFAFLRRNIEAIGVAINPAKAVALPRKGYAPTAEDTSLPGSVDVSIEGEGGATVVGVPIGTGEYVIDRAMEVVKDGGAGRRSRCLAEIPDKQAAVLIVIESLGQRTSCLERADNGAPSAYENILELPGAEEAQSIFQEGCPGNELTLNPHQQAQACLSTGGGRVGYRRRKRGKYLPSEAGRNPTGGSSRPHGPVRRPSEVEGP